MNTFINYIADYIKSKFDLKKEELTVVFPNKRAAYYLRSRLTEIYDEDIWLPQMLSIQEAMTQWSGIHLVDSIDMLFELVSINSELSHSGNNILVFGSLAAQMAKDFDEIDQYEVDASHLFSYVYEEKKLSVWHLDQESTEKERQHLLFFAGLKNYYTMLRQRLERQGKGYYGMITRFLAELSDEELLEKTKGRKVIFAGFNALTPTEERIIDKLYKNHLAEVVWDFDQYYVMDPQNEAGWFARKYMEKNVPWKPQRFSNHLAHDLMEIHLVESKGNTIQTKALQSLLQVSDEAKPAVILADEKLMIPVLNSIPEDSRYQTIKVSMGYPMKHTSLSHFVSSFLTLRRKGKKVNGNGWYIWPILRILDLELLKAFFNEEETEALRRYKEFVREHSLFVFNEEEFAKCCPSPDLRQFMGLLLGTADPGGMDRPIAMLESLTSLLSFIANKIQNGNQGGDKTFLLNQVSVTGKTVNRLKDIMDRYDHYVQDLEELEVLYRLVSANTNIKLNSSSTDGLQLMGILEARNLDFDTFYMLGVNEGILPAEKSYDSFIPYSIRREFHLPGYQEKQAVYAYHFYRQLQGTRKMYFIYNSNGADNGGEPSRFLLQLKYELAQRNPHVTILEEVFDNQTEKEHLPSQLKVDKTDAVMELLMSKMQTDNIQKALAPTSLSTYIQCPLRFYLKYLMGIEDNSMEEETQSNDIGNIVHNTLELLFQKHLNTLISKQILEDVIESSLPTIRQEVILQRFEQGLPDVGYNYLNNLAIDKLFKNYFRYEKDDVERHALYLLQTEYTLHTDLMVNGVKCTVAGKADRIDRHDDMVRIIDYKTGLLSEDDVKVSNKVTCLEEIPEKAFQLLVYKYLYLKEHPEVKPEQVTAALFGLKNKQVSFELRIENPDFQSDFIGTMESMLVDCLASMMDPTIPFDQTKDPKAKPCGICDFKNVCLHSAIGSRQANDR